MKPEEWGPGIWNLFHSLIEKINETDYSIIGLELFSYIKQICNNLPCPQCSMHATKFLSSVKYETINSKDGLKKIIYILHNAVNVRKQKKTFNYDNLEMYKRMNIIQVFNRFLFCFNSTKGNMKLLTDSFQRQIITKQFRKWFLKNINKFNN
jgi:hypothetical protein